MAIKSVASLTLFTIVCFILNTVHCDDENLQKSREYMRQSFASLGDFFNSKVRSFADLWADGYDNLREKVSDTIKYLEKCKENANQIMADAKAKGDEALQKAVNKIDGQLQEARDFQKQLTDNARNNYNNFKKDWETKTQNWWNNGMDRLSAFSQSLKKNCATIVASFSTILLMLSAAFLV